MTRHISVIHTGIIDDCMLCGEPIEFAERDHVFAWRHVGELTAAQAAHHPTPDHLSLRIITDHFLEEREAGRI